MEAWIDWLLGKVQYLCCFYPFFWSPQTPTGFFQPFNSGLLLQGLCKEVVLSVLWQKGVDAVNCFSLLYCIFTLNGPKCYDTYALDLPELFGHKIHVVKLPVDSFCADVNATGGIYEGINLLQVWRAVIVFSELFLITHSFTNVFQRQTPGEVFDLICLCQWGWKHLNLKIKRWGPYSVFVGISVWINLDRAKI